MITVLGYIATVGGLMWGGYIFAVFVQTALKVDLSTLRKQPDEYTVKTHRKETKTYRNDPEPYLPGELETPGKYAIIDLETGELILEA